MRNTRHVGGCLLEGTRQSEAAFLAMDDLRLAAWLPWMTPFEAALSSAFIASRPAATAASLSPASDSSRNLRTAVFRRDFTAWLRWRAFSFCLLRLIWDLMFATCGSSELELVRIGSLVLVGCLATPPKIGTGRIGCRTCSEQHYRHASRAPKSPAALAERRPTSGVQRSAPAASGHRLQHPPRLPDTEIVEGGQVDVDRDHRPHREVRAEPGEEGRDRLVAGLAQRGRRGDRVVEPP